MLLAMAIGVLPPGCVVAQTYPAKPIRIIVSVAASGGVDTTARIVGQQLTHAWGQPVVIENRLGGSGTIATKAVNRAAPNGYTNLMVAFGHASAASLYKPPYDTVSDFAPLTLVVHPSLPVRSAKELVA